MSVLHDRAVARVAVEIRKSVIQMDWKARCSPQKRLEPLFDRKHFVHWCSGQLRIVKRKQSFKVVDRLSWKPPFTRQVSMCQSDFNSTLGDLELLGRASTISG